MSEHDRDAAETGRVEAEAGRVVAEEGRVEAEGEQEHEASRREAEAGRVGAEISREDARKKDAAAVRKGRVVFLGQWGIMVAVAIGFICLIPALAGLLMLDHEIDERCAQAVDGRAAVRAAVASELEILGYRYEPETGEAVATDQGPNDYYAHHPVERQQARDRTLETLRTFPPLKCDHQGLFQGLFG
jgi:hypothetical protein